MTSELNIVDMSHCADLIRMSGRLICTEAQSSSSLPLTILQYGLSAIAELLVILSCVSSDVAV